MTMFSDNLFSTDNPQWNNLSQFFQGGTQDTTGFDLDTSGLNTQPNVYSAPDAQSPGLMRTAAAPPSGAPTNPPTEYDPQNLNEQQWQTLYDMQNQYSLAQGQMEDLAKLWQNNQRIEDMQGLIDAYNFDEGRYRQDQQSAIASGVKDMSQANIGKLIASGQLSSSIGQNYMAGSQAKYLAGSLAQLEDRIQQYKDKEATREFGWNQTLNSLEDADKRTYADLMTKATGLGIEAQQKMFDGLGAVQRGEISWDEFLANYGKMDEGPGGSSAWAPDGAAFSTIGTDLASFISDTTRFPFDTKVTLNNGYSTMKSAVGTDKYKISYFDKNGNEVASYTFNKDDNYTDVARVLWGQFDDAMKADWASTYGGANTGGDTGTISTGGESTGTTGTGGATGGTTGGTWTGWQPTADNYNTIGGHLSSFLTNTEKYPFGEKIPLDSGYSIMKGQTNDGANYQISYFDPDGNNVAYYDFPKDADYTEVAKALWNKFDDGMKADWQAAYENTGTNTTTDPGGITDTDTSYDSWLSGLSGDHGGLAKTEQVSFLGTSYTKYTFGDGTTRSIPTADVGKVPGSAADDKQGWDSAGAIADNFRAGNDWTSGTIKDADGATHFVTFGPYPYDPSREALFIDDKPVWWTNDQYPTLNSYRVGIGFAIARELGLETP